VVRNHQRPQPSGRAGQARSVALEALELFREVDNPTGIALAFLDLAFLATWEGRHEDAIQLAGALESLRERTGGGPPSGFGGMLEGDPAAEAGANLSEEVARRAWEEGRAMSVEEGRGPRRRRPDMREIEAWLEGMGVDALLGLRRREPTAGGA
jgi:hypothetical protein